MRKGATKRPLSLADFGAGDPLGSTRLRERRSLARDVAKMLHLIRRCAGACGGAGLFQDCFRAVEFVRRERAHAWLAACPLDGRSRLMQSRVLRRRGATYAYRLPRSRRVLLPMLIPST